jgi:DNA-binding transcriptional MerR regulator
MTTPAARGLAAPLHFVPIGDLAKRLGVTTRALRYYQEQGLIQPRRLAGNIRAYDLETVAALETIIALREVDLPIATIADILALRDDPPAQAEATHAALVQARADKVRGIALVDAMLDAMLDAAPSKPLSAPARSGLQSSPFTAVRRGFGDQTEGVSA